MNHIMHALKSHSITEKWMHDEVLEWVGDFLEGTTDYNDCPPFGVVNWAFEDWCISALVEEFLDAEIAIVGPTTCRILSLWRLF